MADRRHIKLRKPIRLSSKTWVTTFGVLLVIGFLINTLWFDKTQLQQQATNAIPPTTQVVGHVYSYESGENRMSAPETEPVKMKHNNEQVKSKYNNEIAVDNGNQMIPSQAGNALSSSSSFSQKEVYPKTFYEIHDTSSDGPPLIKFAWLMSFPNSGTSYTMTTIKRVTATTPATNYQSEIVSDKKDSIEDFILHENGPFRLTENYPITPPHGYMLTKTHCGIRCSVCPPEKYLMSLDRFIEECCTSRYFEVDAESGKYVMRDIVYQPSIIQRAVHLFRNPFDNIVSRFNLHWKHNKNDAEWVKLHPKNATGFQEWCKDIDSMWMDEEKKLDNSSNVSTEAVPCHAEFHRYIEWHNLAYRTTDEFSIPVHTMFYEDYAEDFEGTVSNLLFFLNMDKKDNISKAFINSDYSHHFSDEQRKDAIALMKGRANNETWKQLTLRYGF